VSDHRVRWFLATLPLAALAVFGYLCSEWLFLITMPSSTAALAWPAKLSVLAQAPAPYLLPLLGIQTVASLASVVSYPRARAVAVVPAAIAGGLLLLLLIDNFTYTLFRFGTLTTGEFGRIVYITALPVLVALAGWKLFGWIENADRHRHAAIAGTVAAVILAGVHLTAARAPSDQPGSSLPAMAGVPTGSRGAAPRADQPNILFIGVDGVDAALLSAYGYERPTSPFLESIAGDTLFFENAFSNATRTHGSLVTLLTGRLPFHTKVTFPPTVLQGEDTRRSLPMLLKQLGYTTLQLALRHYADAEDVNLFGFDAANYRWQNLRELKPEDTAASETDVFRSAVAERLDDRLAHLLFLAPVADTFAHVEGRVVVPKWRDERRVATLVDYFAEAPEPWFVHLHMLDTHCCDWAPDKRRFTGGATNQIDSRDSTFLEADEHIRQLYQALADTGRLERTIVVISSDHASQWLATQRVPLMIRFPHATPSGRVSANVQLADVAPTMVDYLGATVPAWMDGVSLLKPENQTADRTIVGIADLERREGVAGMRLLLESGPPNYGVSAVMLVSGPRWHVMSLHGGVMRSGDVIGHTRATA
jgi:hypothetical protein